MLIKMYRWISAAFVIVFYLSFCSRAIAITNSTQVKIPSGTSYTYTTMMVNITLTSPTSIAYCKTSTTMVINFLICPPTSTKNTLLTIASADVRNSICNRATVDIGSGASLKPVGNKGVQLVGLTCTVPIGAWIPSSVLATVGTNTATSAVLLGEDVFISFQNGTVPFVQPDATKTYFDLISGNWGQIGDSSDKATFLKKLLPNGFNSFNSTISQCSGSPPGGGNWCS